MGGTDGGHYLPLMMNPAIDAGALKAFSREIAAKETERNKCEHRLAQVGSESMQGPERLETAMRTAYARASDCFSRIASETHLNRFVEDYIGPMVLCGDGRAKPRRLATTTASDESEAVVTSNIAGGGFEPPTSGL
jgi:hypothetical protein